MPAVASLVGGVEIAGPAPGRLDPADPVVETVASFLTAHVGGSTRVGACARVPIDQYPGGILVDDVYVGSMCMVCGACHVPVQRHCACGGVPHEIRLGPVATVIASCRIHKGSQQFAMPYTVVQAAFAEGPRVYGYWAGDDVPATGERARPCWVERITLRGEPATVRGFERP